MKVILTEQMDKLGAPHDVVEVADGYARNFLVPRGMAVPATKSAMANLDNMKRVDDRRQNRLRGGAEELAAKIEGKTLVMPANVGEKGRLYGSISNADIAEELKKQFDVEIDRKNIRLSEPIREVGVYPIPVVLHRDITKQLVVQVGDAPAIDETKSEAAPSEETVAADA